VTSVPFSRGRQRISVGRTVGRRILPLMRGRFRAQCGTPFVCPAGSTNAGQTVTVKTPYSGNMVDPATFDPVDSHISQSLPTTSNPSGFVYLFGQTAVDSTNEFLIRGDYNLNEKNHINGRVFYQRFNLASNGGGGDFC